jgi:hypothetical protein
LKAEAPCKTFTLFKVLMRLLRTVFPVKDVLTHWLSPMIARCVIGLTESRISLDNEAEGHGGAIRTLEKAAVDERPSMATLEAKRAEVRREKKKRSSQASEQRLNVKWS